MYLLRPSKNTGNISRKRERARTRKTPHPPGENALKLSGYDIFSERVHRRQRRKTGRTFSVRPWTTIISNEEGNDRLPVASDILSRAIMSRLDGERAVIVPNKYLSSRVGGFEGVQISRIESKSKVDAEKFRSRNPLIVDPSKWYSNLGCGWKWKWERQL